MRRVPTGDHAYPTKVVVDLYAGSPDGLGTAPSWILSLDEDVQIHTK